MVDHRRMCLSLSEEDQLSCLMTITKIERETQEIAFVVTKLLMSIVGMLENECKKFLMLFLSI